ncbi:uncharacterized protein LOC125667802 [Ostrea edulis]|uniref:uncharacterized protein LOC125667802 n=1 Tax=Ostrea edulis TaxID=37623 RepID=UPI0024AF8786|nr:uncharacterized protein LOC125667802 [Ostrea edulis]
MFGKNCFTDNNEESQSEGEEDTACNGYNDLQSLKQNTTTACSCGKNCLKNIGVEEIQNSILTTKELTRDEKDMFIMGRLMCTGFGSNTQRGKERKRKKYAYYFQNQEICKGSFLFAYGVGSKYVKNLVSHMNENGHVPRTHKNKNRRPSNAFHFDDLKNAIDYIQNYAEEFGLPQPTVKNKSIPITYLPSSGSKTTLHSLYSTSCDELGKRKVGLTTFKLLWKDCCPHIKYMTPRSDICPICEDCRARISTAVGLVEKQEDLRIFTEHLSKVEMERQVYNDAVKKARDEFSTVARPAGLLPPCSTNLQHVHYTFDFSQALSIPHHARQEGPLYFLTPRKVQLFGVALEGCYQQVNYIVDEDQGMGENGAGVKGSNGVISMLHHCLTTFGSGEKECIIHCDNCAGENKNRYVLGYLSWRTLLGLHKDITLSTQVPYHGRCLVDAGFANIKRLYHRTDVDSLSGLVDVINRSAKSNRSVTYLNDAGEHNWEWFDWKTFISQYFGPVRGIRKMHHFRFSSSFPGKMYVRERADQVETEIVLLKSAVTPEDLTANTVMPDIVPPGGISAERQKYLYRMVRPFVRDPYKELTCPNREE